MAITTRGVEATSSGGTILEKKQQKRCLGWRFDAVWDVWGWLQRNAFLAMDREEAKHGYV
jgi:hypothetical protein